MANDLLLEFVFICEGMSLELLPCFALRFGDRSYIIRYLLELIVELILKVNRVEQDNKLTLNTFDLSSTETRKGTLVFRTSDTGGADGTL